MRKENQTHKNPQILSIFSQNLGIYKEKGQPTKTLWNLIESQWPILQDSLLEIEPALNTVISLLEEEHLCGQVNSTHILE